MRAPAVAQAQLDRPGDTSDGRLEQLAASAPRRSRPRASSSHRSGPGPAGPAPSPGGAPSARRAAAGLDSQLLLLHQVGFAAPLPGLVPGLVELAELPVEFPDLADQLLGPQVVAGPQRQVEELESQRQVLGLGGG